MSDFISYKNNMLINLDLVCDIFQPNFETSKKIIFTFASSNDEGTQYEEWNFETREEAVNTYNHLRNTLSTSISDEMFMGDQS